MVKESTKLGLLIAATIIVSIFSILFRIYVWRMVHPVAPTWTLIFGG